MYKDYALEIHHLNRRIEYLTRLNSIVNNNPRLFPDLIKDQIDPLIEEFPDVCSLDVLIVTLKQDEDR